LLWALRLLTFRDGVMFEGRLLFLFYFFKDGVVFKIISEISSLPPRDFVSQVVKRSAQRTWKFMNWEVFGTKTSSLDSKNISFGTQ
jgi:hypothetical protein